MGSQNLFMDRTSVISNSLRSRAPRSSRRRPPRGRRCPRASRAQSAWPGTRRPRSPQVPPPPPQTVMEMSRCVWRGARETRQSCLPFPRGFPSLALLDAPGARGNLTSALPASLRSARSRDCVGDYRGSVSLSGLLYRNSLWILACSWVTAQPSDINRSVDLYCPVR